MRLGKRCPNGLRFTTIKAHQGINTQPLTILGSKEGPGLLFINKPSGVQRLAESQIVSGDETLCDVSYSPSLNQLVVIPCPVDGSNTLRVHLRSDSGVLLRSVTVTHESGWRLEHPGVVKTTGLIVDLKFGSGNPLNFFKDYRRLLVRLTDGSSRLLPEKIELVEVSKDANWALTKSSVDGTYHLYELGGARSQKTLPLNTVAAAFDPAGGKLYSLQQGGELLSLDLVSQTQISVCPSIERSIALLNLKGKDFSQATALLVLGETLASGGNTEVFSLQQNQCVRRNGFPTRLAGTVEAFSSSSSSQVVMLNTSLPPATFKQSVYVVPMDGRPVRWLNPGGINFREVRTLVPVEKHGVLVIQSKGWGNLGQEFYEKFFLFSL